MTTNLFRPSLFDAAQTIVDNCVGDEAPACTASCPLHVDVKQYIRLAAAGEYEQSLQVIRQQLFMPQTLGRICQHPCEQQCPRRQNFENPVNIAAIKRFVAERADDPEKWDVTTLEPTGKTVAIIGGGPAGMQAAVQLKRLGHDVTIFDKNDKLGGMLQYGIAPFRLPRRVVNYETGYLSALGINVHMNTELGEDITLIELQQQFGAVILATGAWLNKPLNINGAEPSRIVDALQLLHVVSQTQNFQPLGERVLVIGGGDEALDCARTSWRLGSQTVHLCADEPAEALTANHQAITEAVDEGINIHAGWHVERIDYNLDGSQQVTISYPTFDGSQTRLVEVDAIINATGRQVQDVAEGLVSINSHGHFDVDSDLLTTDCANLFIAGEAVGSRNSVEAMASGRKAALSVERFLQQRPLTDERDLAHECSYRSRLQLTIETPTLNDQRMELAERPVTKRRDFEEISHGFNAYEMKDEASRCMDCGCDQCLQTCRALKQAGVSPKQLFAQFIATKQFDSKIAYGCEQCDPVCPQKLPVSELLTEIRNDLRAANIHLNTSLLDKVKSWIRG